MPIELQSAGREWAKIAYDKAVKAGHPSPETLVSLIYETSRFNPGAIGYNDTLGIGRFTEDQAETLGIDPRDPYQSIDAVIEIDRSNLEALQDRDLATAAFFVGPEQVAEMASTGEAMAPELAARMRRVADNTVEVMQVVSPLKISDVVPEAPSGVSFSEATGATLQDVDLPVLYDRARTGEVESAAFIGEYMRRKFKDAGVKVK